MPNRLFRIVSKSAATAFLATALARPATLSSQSIVGTVTERSSGTAIMGAAVILHDAKRTVKGAVTSNAEGTYSIVVPSAGSYYLSVQKSGLTSIETEMFKISSDSVHIMNIEAGVAAPQLTPVTVIAKATVNTSGPNKHKYDQFLLRKSLGMGTFLTREQIEAKPATQTYQLFQNIPGLKISQNGTQWIIRSQRCPAKLPTGGPPPDMDFDIPGLPILFIDGFRVRGLGTLSTLNPSEIEAIEVYQGAAQLPAEAKGNACAAIFVWTKQRP